MKLFVDPFETSMLNNSSVPTVGMVFHFPKNTKWRLVNNWLFLTALLGDEPVLVSRTLLLHGIPSWEYPSKWEELAVLRDCIHVVESSDTCQGAPLTKSSHWCWGWS